MKKLLLTFALLALILGCDSGDRAGNNPTVGVEPAGVRDPGGGIAEAGVRDPGGGYTNDQDGVRDPGGGVFLIIVRSAQGRLIKADHRLPQHDGEAFLEYGIVVNSDTTWGFLSLDNALDRLQKHLNVW